MDVFLYNTFSHSKELFQPLDPQHISLYVCGPTVYDTAHIGNARSVLVFDVLYRFLRQRYPKVTYVRNVTDIDDKIILAARAAGTTIARLTESTTARFHEDMAALGALPPTHEPRATAHIPQIISLITSLLEAGHAYVAQEHVLFGVASFPHYGRLSRLPLEEQRAGARVEVAPYKKDPADFVLWKPSPPDPLYPGWDSPWGYGRPGWHIECSAMSAQYLPLPLDIHGGGQDLIFPHHENEIAQTCCAHNISTLAQFWMHNGILTVNGEKMSKSLENFVTVPQALAKWPREVIRWSLLSAHYRQPLDWSDSLLSQSQAALDRLYGALRSSPLPVPLPADACVVSPPCELMAILSDDLNTPRALSYLHALATAFYKASDEKTRKDFAQQLWASGQFLGFFQQLPTQWFTQAPALSADVVAGPAGPSPSEDTITDLIAQRQQDRRQGNFKEADRIRDTLLSQGIVLEDTSQHTTWRRIRRPS